jgi:hypothetical protein
MSAKALRVVLSKLKTAYRYLALFNLFLDYLAKDVRAAARKNKDHKKHIDKT